MSAALSSNFSSWAATLSANPESLTIELSSKNVEHALKTAVTRTPQKILLSAILPHVMLCLQNNVATSVLAALVRFATPKSVGQVCAAILPKWKEVQGALDTSAEMGSLLADIVTRSDDTSESRKEILRHLNTLPIDRVMGNAKLLRVAAALVIVEPVYASKVLKSKEALKVFTALLTAETKCKEAIRFVELTLTSVEDKAPLGKWVLQAMKAADPKARHRSEVVAAIAETEVVEVCEALAKAMLTWPELGVKGSMAKALTKLLSIVGESSGKALAKKAMESTTVAELSSDKGTQLAGLGVVIGQKFASLLSAEDAARLVALKVRIEAATKPKNLSTKDIILEKIRQFEATQKRPRAE